MAEKKGIHRQKADRVTALQPGRTHRNRLTTLIEGAFPTEDTREARRKKIRALKEKLDAEELKVSRQLVKILASRRRAELSGDAKEIASLNLDLQTLRRYYTHQLQPMISRTNALVLSLDKTIGLKATVEAMALAESELKLSATEFDPDEIEDIADNLREDTDDIDSHIKVVKTFETTDMLKTREKLKHLNAVPSIAKNSTRIKRTKDSIPPKKEKRASEAVGGVVYQSPRSHPTLKRQDTPVPRNNRRGGGGNADLVTPKQKLQSQAELLDVEERKETDIDNTEDNFSDSENERSHRRPSSAPIEIEPGSAFEDQFEEAVQNEEEEEEEGDNNDSDGEFRATEEEEEEEERKYADLMMELLSPELDVSVIPPTIIRSQSEQQTKEKV